MLKLLSNKSAKIKRVSIQKFAKGTQTAGAVLRTAASDWFKGSVAFKASLVLRLPSESLTEISLDVISVSDSDGGHSTKGASNAIEPLNQSEIAVLRTAPAV